MSPGPRKRRRSSSAARRGKARARTPEAVPPPPEYLRRLGVQPRKALGQNFLVDEFLLGDIAAAATVDPETLVLEIGAGPGGLTEELVQRARRVVAIELDEELASITRARLASHSGLHVLAADVLEFAPIELLRESGVEPPHTQYVAVGNLPYYITQPIVRLLLEADPAPERIVILVQREVAVRMVGGPGKESLLSNSIKMYGEPRLLFPVPRQAFWPAPKVQSAVVAIDRFERPALDLTRAEIEAFFHVVRAGFAQPRKQLHNSLVDESGLPRDEILALLEDAGIDPAARPQHLTLMDWGRVYHLFQERFPGELDVPDVSGDEHDAFGDDAFEDGAFEDDGFDDENFEGGDLDGDRRDAASAGGADDDV